MLKSIILVISLILCIIDCSREHTHQINLAAGTEQYITRFVEDARAQNIYIIINDLMIVFRNFPSSPIIGQCIQHENATPLIQISTDFWTHASDSDKELLLFHELGHCILNRGHRSGWIVLGQDTIPISVMYPDFIGSYDYETYKSYYLYELFNIIY